MALAIKTIKNDHKLHCKESRKFIIMHVLTSMFYIEYYKNKFYLNHPNSIHF